MANQQIPGPAFTIDSSADGTSFYIGSADANERVVGTYAILFVSSSFSGAVTIKATSSDKEAGLSGTTAQTTPIQCSYLSDYLNGTALAVPQYNNATITGTSQIWIPCSGRQIVLSCAVTSGSLTAYLVPCFGAAA